MSAQNANPYNICSWRPVSECTECPLAGQLKCRVNWGDLFHFVGLFLLFAFPSLIGMMRSGHLWYILGWVGFWIFFFEIWEIRILCSHCPYYAEKGWTLHCIANYSSLKLWRYHPEPISSSEKIQLITGFIILSGYPFPFLILGKQFTFAFLAFWALVMFFWTLRKYTCSACVNFSCVLNTVPREIVDEHIKRNPVMKRAWEAHGWV